jgi:hypothetical protein
MKNGGAKPRESTGTTREERLWQLYKIALQRMIDGISLFPRICMPTPAIANLRTREIFRRPHEFPGVHPGHPFPPL